MRGFGVSKAMQGRESAPLLSTNPHYTTVTAIAIAIAIAITKETSIATATVRVSAEAVAKLPIGVTAVRARRTVLRTVGTRTRIAEPAVQLRQTRLGPTEVEIIIEIMMMFTAM